MLCFEGASSRWRVVNLKLPINQAMRTKGILAQTVIVGVRALKDNLPLQRDSYDISFLSNTRERRCPWHGRRAVLPRRKKVARHLQDGML